MPVKLLLFGCDFYDWWSIEWSSKVFKVMIAVIAITRSGIVVIAVAIAVATIG